jgi:hypothetical protein
MLLQHQHVEPIDEDSVTAADIVSRLFARKSGCAERNAGLKNRLFHVLDGIEEDRRIEFASNAELGRQVERRDHQVVNALALQMSSMLSTASFVSIKRPHTASGPRFRR